VPSVRRCAATAASQPPATTAAQPASGRLSAESEKALRNREQALKDEVSALKSQLADKEAFDKRLKELNAMAKTVADMRDKLVKSAGDAAEAAADDSEITGATKLQDIPNKLRNRANKTSEYLQEQAQKEFSKRSEEAKKKAAEAKADLPKKLAQKRQELEEKSKTMSSSDVTQAYEEYASKLRDFEKQDKEAGGQNLTMIELGVVVVFLAFWAWQHRRASSARAKTQETVDKIEEAVSTLNTQLGSACENFRDNFVPADEKVRDVNKRSVEQTHTIDRLTESLNDKVQARKDAQKAGW